jgi:hypothetical protein
MFQKWLDDDILNLQIELSCKYFAGIFGLATFLDTFETMANFFIQYSVHTAQKTTIDIRQYIDCSLACPTGLVLVE